MWLDEWLGKWLDKAADRGVSAVVIAEIARRHGIMPDSFDILHKMEEITDPDGKSFFLIHATRHRQRDVRARRR